MNLDPWEGTGRRSGTYPSEMTQSQQISMEAKEVTITKFKELVFSTV
jgi:hypothetical protein